MNQTFQGDITNNVVELNLQAEAVNIATPTVAYDGESNGLIEQAIGDIDDTSGFKEDASLYGLVLGTSCTAIGSYSFYYCTGLKGSLAIPDTVTSIGDQAFDHCDGLTGSLTIGNSVTSIGSNAFYYCEGLTGDLVIPDSVTNIGSFAFAYWGISTPIGTLTIGNSVASIGSYAFSYSYFTGDLIIPDSVTAIGDSAFADWNFTNVLFNGNIVIGSGVTSIGSSAFYGVGTTALYINCPASSWIGTNALIRTSPLTDIYVHADYVAGYDATWKSSQSTSATVSTWTNYPNIP